MADVVVDSENKSPKELLGQGIRAYILQDFSTAVAALSKASELLVAEHGNDLHESLADVYLYYGKALLGLSREESEALGDAVPKNNDEESDDDEGDEGEEDAEAEDGEGKETETEAKANGNGKVETEEQVTEGESSKPEDGPSSSASKEEETTAADQETEEKTGDDEPTDLQLAWEVLELAKKIFEKNGQEGKRNLAETMTVLGEISLESENFEAAVNDIKEGLEIQKQLFGKDSRTVAETFYKLGMAYSTNSQIDEAIESFNSSLEYLQNRIGHLEKIQNEKYAAVEEINEIKNLIPDIEEKIADMKSYKDETLKKIMSAVTEQKPSDSTASSSQSSSKPATDISHLVKRKRKLDEIIEDCEKEAEGSPAKKPQP